MKRLMLLSMAVVCAAFSAGCPHEKGQVNNPWLVPFQERQTSALSRSQMRAMARLARIYKENGMEREYTAAMVTAVEIFAGDRTVTFELLNHLIDGINETRFALRQLERELDRMGIRTDTLSSENLPDNELAARYLAIRDDLQKQYEECFRILVNACWQIPYDPELYYRAASLQFIRAEEDGDRNKYKDAVNYLKRAIASNSQHLESYYLIALAYERLGDKDRAVRFWRLFEIIYEVGPQVMGDRFITPERERMHQEARAHLAQLGVSSDE